MSTYNPIPSDADYRQELLLQIAMDLSVADLLALPAHDLKLVLETRRQYADLLLSLAIKIEAGVRPQPEARK